MKKPRVSGSRALKSAQTQGCMTISSFWTALRQTYELKKSRSAPKLKSEVSSASVVFSLDSAAVAESETAQADAATTIINFIG